MKTVCMFLAGCLVSVNLWAADVNGRWTAEMPSGGGNTMTVTLKLEVDEDRLTGTVTGPDGETEISDGIIDDDNITFKVIRAFEGNQITQRFEGTVNDDTIRFSVTTEGGRRGGREARQFEAHRDS